DDALVEEVAQAGRSGIGFDVNEASGAVVQVTDFDLALAAAILHDPPVKEHEKWLLRCHSFAVCGFGLIVMRRALECTCGTRANGRVDLLDKVGVDAVPRRVAENVCVA